MTAKADIDHGDFEVNATFSLGAASNGIDPLAEDVTLVIGGVAVTIPAGSFRSDKKGRFKFEGTAGGAGIQVQIRPLGGPAFVFKAEGERASLNDAPNPLTVDLQIGNDKGSVIATNGNQDDDDD